MGITEEKLTALAHYETSDLFGDEERLALDLAVAMTDTPATVDDDLRARLADRFTTVSYTHLTLPTKA